MKIDFYYWASMCPLNIEFLNLFREYESRLDIHVHDITHDPTLARQFRIYYPTLTVVNNHFRFYNPLSRSFLDRLCNGTVPKEVPYHPVLGTQTASGTIVPITRSNYHIACCCTGRAACGGCDSKIRFLENNGLSVFGFMNLNGNTLLGGAEYMPSVLVPYDIPHEKKTAFLTCIYLSNNRFDYKTAPLKALEKHLSQSYEKICVITDEKGVFPNGDMSFFLRNGYADKGTVAKEGNYCTLHLMEKQLR